MMRIVYITIDQISTCMKLSRQIGNFDATNISLTVFKLITFECYLKISQAKTKVHKIKIIFILKKLI